MLVLHRSYIYNYKIKKQQHQLIQNQSNYIIFCIIFNTFNLCYLYQYIIIKMQNQMEQDHLQNKVESPSPSPSLQLQESHGDMMTQKKVAPHPVNEFKHKINNKSIKQSLAEKTQTSKDVQQSPEYYRINNEICNKLYGIYKKMKISLSQQAQTYSFQEKQLSNNTLNYHKIMQMFKDLDFKLEINQKLQLLRSIKKFCFNQNFINQQEFIKIYKVIVHAIGVKQLAFKTLIQNKIALLPKKEEQMQKKNLSIKINKNFGKKMKTQAPTAQYTKKQKESLLQEHRTLVGINNNYSKKYQTNPVSIVQESKAPSTVRRGQSRKRTTTQANRYDIGMNRGYLERAIQKSKLGKLTWQNLFKMNENNLHHNIIIPSFVFQGINQFDLEI